MKNRIRYIGLLILLTLLSFIGCKNQSIISKAKLVWHKPVSEDYFKNINSELKWTKKEMPDSLSEKKYIISGLKHQLSPEIFDLAVNDTSTYEKEIIELLRGVDSLKKLKKIVIIGECFSGEAFTCLSYVFMVTDTGCFCNYKNSYKYFYNKSCDMNLLNNFLEYIKNRKTIPDEKYFQEFDAGNTFRLYVITKEDVYANRFYTTSEYLTLDAVTSQWYK